MGTAGEHLQGLLALSKMELTRWVLRREATGAFCGSCFDWAPLG